MADLRKLSKKELLETFDKFLLAVDFRIEHLKYVTKDDSYNWDFSIASLENLEDFIIQKDIDENHDLYDDIASYLGEVVRRNYNGKWECCLDMKENSMLYGMPVISDFNKYGVLYCPYEELGIFLLHKEKGILTKNIEMIINSPDISF